MIKKILDVLESAGKLVYLSIKTALALFVVFLIVAAVLIFIFAPTAFVIYVASKYGYIWLLMLPVLWGVQFTQIRSQGDSNNV